MKKTILSFFVLAGTALTSFAQTTLQAGDIAFVGIQSGETGQTAKDRFAFILLKDIDENTQINFTDNAVINNQPVKFCKNEGTSRWTSTSAMTAGTIVSISEDSIASSGSANGGLAFSQSGDQVLAYQTSGTDTFMLAGISNTGWETSCGSTCGGANNNKTCLPSPLINEVNAIGFSTIKKNAYFNLPNPSGTPAEILAAINNPANWTQEDVLQIWPSWNVTVITSNQELIGKQKFMLFPTVSDGNFTLENNSGSSYEFTIHNVLGQIQFSGIAPVGKKEFSFHGLSKGLYFVSSKNKEGNSGVFRFQIIK
jgi:hypothetical protein